MQNIIYEICNKNFGVYPAKVEECKIGFSNYVYSVELHGQKYMVRCNDSMNAYKETIYLLNELSKINLPVPKIIANGYYRDYAYLILTYIQGQDIGEVYTTLTPKQKQQIALDVIQIQNRVAELDVRMLSAEWAWEKFIDEMLETAKDRIASNAYFDFEKVNRLYREKYKLDTYFMKISPKAYLDDISTKNLIINNGKLSGIIDIDNIGIGDKLTFVALTYIALLNMEYDTDYVKYLLKYMNISQEEQKAFFFYSLLYCVDFMGERGMTFAGRKVEVNSLVIQRLNGIYDELWSKWLKCLENHMDTENFLTLI